jgi:hypothetical protein
VDSCAVVVQTVHDGDIVLQDMDIPQDLVPRSLEPTCELLDGDVVKALQSLQPGDIVSILPNNGEDYQEIELDLQTERSCKIRQRKRTACNEVVGMEIWW